MIQDCDILQLETLTSDVLNFNNSQYCCVMAASWATAEVYTFLLLSGAIMGKKVLLSEGF